MARSVVYITGGREGIDPAVYVAVTTCMFLSDIFIIFSKGQTADR